MVDAKTLMKIKCERKYTILKKNIAKQIIHILFQNMKPFGSVQTVNLQSVQKPPEKYLLMFKIK